MLGRMLLGLGVELSGNVIHGDNAAIIIIIARLGALT